MNRREALKNLGLLLASPKIYKTSKMINFINSNKISHTKYQYQQKWLKNNENWIKKNWISKSKIASDPHKIFFGLTPFGQSNKLIHRYMQIFKNYNLEWLTQDLMFALVFGKDGSFDMKTNDGTTSPFHLMSGFCEQVGRMPTIEDKVQLYHLNNKFYNSYYSYENGKNYCVECLIHVDLKIK